MVEALFSPRLVAPSRPRRPLSAGACDCHAHIFGPFDRFPVLEGSKAKAILAPADDYRAMLDRVGFDRAVLVQPSAYREDSSALIDALVRNPMRFRGIAVADASVSDRDLAVLHGAGVRGLRFNELVSGASIGLAHLERLAPRLNEIGWHAQLYATCERIAEALPRLRSYGIPIVVDHLARVGPSNRTLDDPAFRAVAEALREGWLWIKLTAYRNGRRPPAFDDVRGFHDAFVDANPDRLLWGSDWPYLSALGDPPDTGHLLDVFGDWVADEDIRRKILVANPATLYGFDGPRPAA